MLRRNRERRIETIVAYFPENPIIVTPNPNPYYDRELSNDYVSLLAQESASNGARFWNLRDLLTPLDFWDLNHVNQSGREGLTDELAVRTCALLATRGKE